MEWNGMEWNEPLLSGLDWTEQLSSGVDWTGIDIVGEVRVRLSAVAVAHTHGAHT